MSGWIKSVVMTLSVMVTAGVLSVLSAPVAVAAAAGSDPVTVHAEGAVTFNERTAARAYRKVAAQVRRDQRSARTSGRPVRVKPIGHLSRWQNLPPRLATPIQGLVASGARKVDADGQIAWVTGTNDGAACLSLNDGNVRRGLCGLGEPVFVSLDVTYQSLVLTAQWFDTHDDVYGKTVRSTALITGLIQSEAPVGATAQIADADADGLVDGGTLRLEVGDSCGTVTLPEHDPTGESYVAGLDYDC